MVAKSTIRLFSAILVAGALAAGCGSSEDDKPDMEVTTDTLSDDVRAEIQSIRASIPSPSELTAGMASSKFKYNKDLMNPSSKAGSYSSNFQKAAAMGAYGTDMGYAAAYGQAQDMIEYFGAVNKLAKDLGLESAFDEQLVGLIKDNINKKDTVVDLIDRAFNKAERHLRSNQRVATAAVIAAGGWIESIYLSSSQIKDSPKDSTTAALYDRTWGHVNSFKHVIDLLNEYKSNADCAKMLEMLKDLQPYVDKTNKQGGGVLTKEEVTDISNKIAEVRNKILS
jgi:hypothetical protein